MSNQSMNDFIRQRGKYGRQTQMTVTSAPEAPHIAPGNAGSGTGSPPAALPLPMDQWIRLAAGHEYVVSRMQLRR